MSIMSTGLRDGERGGLRPLAVSVSTAADLTGLSVRTIWQLIREEKLAVKRTKGRTLIKFSSLQAWLDAEDTTAA